MFPEAGERLGPYEILGELGGGGMARVYRAWDGRLHREVAIKVIDDRFAMPGIGERFLREARAASGLNHPNICTIFDIGEQDGAPYLVMELLEGETLREKISRDPISVEDILRHGAEISDALAAAHARGIVHRDVKPANIFLVKKPNGSTQSKVLDFGLAKIEQYASEEREIASHLTSMGATVGTVSYMSPEQARGEKLDARSDLFSLGIVMYEMATGQLPFQGNTSALVFVQLLGQMAPEQARKLNGQIPSDLDQLIMKLLSKNPRSRYQSATELYDELHDLAEKRSGWLTRTKTPSAFAPNPDARGAVPRPSYTLPNSPLAAPKSADSPKGKSPLGASPSREIVRALPARPGDPQGVRAPGRRRKESAEHKSQQQKRVVPRSEVRPENRGGASSGQVSAARGPMSDLPSAIKPMRTSIATNPKISYPAAAPYQSGMHRTGGAADGAEDQSAEEAAQASGSSLSGFRQVTSEPRPSGVRAAAQSPSGANVAGNETDSTLVMESGINWRWIILAIAVLVLVGGFLAWRFGWLGGAVPMQGCMILVTRLSARPETPRSVSR